MDNDDVRKLLTAVQKKSLTVEKALHKLRILPFKDIAYAKLDTHRSIRKGFPEVLYCEGKKTMKIVKIFSEFASTGGNVIASRADIRVYNAIKKKFSGAFYYKDARIIVLLQKPLKKQGMVVIVTAGTADRAIAEEARVTAEVLGANTGEIYDVGIAGIHRLFPYIDRLYKAQVIIVVAGMEGALPGVVAGLVDTPVIGVPTSIGYGSSFGGIAALLGMLNSCSPGMTVVNIDNGFGAGYAAGIINRDMVNKKS